MRVVAKKGDVFVRLSHEGDKKNPFIGIEVLRPDLVFPRYGDDDYKEMVACAVKYFNLVDTGERNWFAQVYYPDVIQLYDLGREAGGGDSSVFSEDSEGNIIKIRRQYHIDKKPASWQLIDEIKNPFGVIPIFHIKNNVDDLPFGVSDLQVMTDLQDLLNITVTDLAHVMDTQAFTRVLIFGANNLDKIDIGPGVWTAIPNESGRAQPIPPGPIADYLYTIDTIIEQISAVTRTPRQVFRGYDNVPTSGYALNIRFMQLDAKCNEKKEEIKHALRRMNQVILATAVNLGWVDEFLMELQKEYSDVDTDYI